MNHVNKFDPTGGRGNVYIGTGFAHSRRATLNVEMATWNIDVLASQNGTVAVPGSAEVTYYDVMTADTDGTFKTKFTAVGATGAEIGYVYKVADDGTYSTTFTQAQTATEAGSFAYASATKTITFADTDPNKPTAADTLACAYTFMTAANAQKITVDAGAVPPTVMLSAYGIARDICNGELFPCVIEGQAQVDGNWNFDLSADGEPVVQNLSMEFVKGCLNNTLYTFTVYTEDELE